ncbi:MAG TPA: hypothetical protein VK177_19920 [Flavobacteriales bacterium]|nr:hypothetical protein [Flavobacteriales bacterium]
MRLFISCSCFLLFHVAHGQQRDTRADLEISGRINDISVAPNEALWIVTALQEAYYTNSIKDAWHYCAPPFDHKKEDVLSTNGDHLDRVSFFNKDTAIITGYIGKGAKNGYYLTHDGGKTWLAKTFKGDGWIYDVYVGENGRAWMGGSSGDIFYSDDFGGSFKKLNSPYGSNTRMARIFMLNGKYGIAGALHNDINITHNNWKTYSKIKTPADQGKYKNEGSGYSDDRINNILQWKNYLVVEQNTHVFYTDTGKIDWKPFKLDVIEFTLDSDNDQLVLIDKEKYVWACADPINPKKMFNDALPFYPLGIQLVNGSLYTINGSGKMARLDKNGCFETKPYTTDHPIQKPKITAKASQFYWGADGSELFLSTGNEAKDWYRIHSFEFRIWDLKLMGDSTVLLWDGYENYLYSLGDDKPVKYQFTKPLEEFTKSAISKVKINAGTRGCYHYVQNEVNFNATVNQLLEASGIVKSEMGGDTVKAFSAKIPKGELETILAGINANPFTIPAISEFGITEKDIEGLDKLVGELKKEGRDYFGNKQPDLNFYREVAKHLDTVSVFTLDKILGHGGDYGYSTTSCWFSMEFINSNGDELTIYKTYYDYAGPWYLPWNVEFKGRHFFTNSLGLSKALKKYLPADFYGIENFDNSLFLLRLASHLQHERDAKK